ncbi:cell division protein FtsQ/DivIB [Nocardia cyriacigeorgica]|uniref:cell division protein FtsQ/DivIB n=1 Tax=Nocardia cyriacigeorgica TaxID=135487 RepID=UPI0013CF9718|nr:FtsQ-type POTRA domain-containing protein [Nocardia cyriacigeorgica]MBF6439177.1 FtsQ-type POTRA domain-containing protein [Nocardia cyriacigeorgica]MBF6455435.1 FtsQ-type POTRA domain-containing protein [Nocardia cyriacigeorgica]MBF6481411.1 FtsQ-type POTRA domain-containing protein [Nocardia cyriacigeorgica]MBF6553823.1 FtsQ-type POTRA domain-containing protein [Nocardia cyriacigeorgica]NEW29336.1 FtsQ-type POTRA domain-containing protein [Nocardia cyriacigeorgica]
MRSGAELFGARGWRRIRLWGLPAVCLLITVIVVAWFTPLLSVRTVQIQGLSAVPEEQVRELLEIPDGQSMLRIDTAAMAARVASIPKVSTVRVQRSFPSTVRVTITERAPVLFYTSERGAHLLDAESVEYAIEPPPIGVPELTADHPGSADPGTRAAVAVVTALPPALRVQVGEVAVRSISDISLRLRDGRTVLWGGADDAERKVAVVGPLLTRPGTVFDVSSPDLVTVK